MRRTIEIIGNSFKMALQELWKNKLRTFLSLFGVTIGIFCIIGVLATVQSLEHNIQNEIKSLGTNTIYYDKWDYSAGGGPDYPWWKFVKRPFPKYEELDAIKKRSGVTQYAAFKIETTGNVEYSDNILSNTRIYGISDDFEDIQPFDIRYGRYVSDVEFNAGTSVFVVGYNVAEKLFGEAERAVGKTLNAKGKKALIIGVIKKQGKQMIGGWDFDQSIVTPYRFARSFIDERSDNAQSVIMIQGGEGVSSIALKDDLKGVMRSIHKLSPKMDDNFSLNDVNEFSDAVSSLFAPLNIGGAVIALLSLIVGMFGVANIMFVTVRERTGQIGLKKAVGAKNRVILAEFLLESAFLCIIGGVIGLTLVFILAKILSGPVGFPVFVSTSNMILAIVICIITGILAGIIPAIKASKMDPVVAIRSK
jgi:putative ABC transport system permease protein